MMSRLITNTFNCPCGEKFEHPIYDYVNVAKEPRLRYIVLAGLLNVATCPNCGRKAAIGRPFIYSDPERQLLAYVHPRNDAPPEARLMILDQLRNVYENIVGENEQAEQPTGENKQTEQPTGVNEQTEQPTSETVSEDSAAQIMSTAPLQVVFGIDQLHELINATLSQDERLGKLALSMRSHAEAERGQMLDIARKLASEMNCLVEVEDLEDEYTVWILGPRRQIGALMRELSAAY